MSERMNPQQRGERFGALLSSEPRCHVPDGHYCKYGKAQHRGERSCRYQAHDVLLDLFAVQAFRNQSSACCRSENQAVGKIAGPSKASLPPASMVSGKPAGTWKANFLAPAAP